MAEGTVLFGMKAVAKYLNVSVKKVKKYFKAGMPYMRDGNGMYTTTQEQIKEWFHERIEKKESFKPCPSKAVRPRDRIAIIEKHNGRCAICGMETKSGYAIDHIVPVSKGGTREIENLQLLCKMCNTGKWNWDQATYIEHCRIVVENNANITRK